MKHAELERLFTLIGCGRIEEILSAIKRIHNVEDVADLNAETKLSVLCNCLQLDPEALDNLIATNSAVLRTVKGHSFEVALEVLLKKQGCEVEDIGGDTCVDLVVNSHTLQLKTPNVGGTSQSAIEYKTHKTHGAKSQVESMSYYHRIESFADFFVGLISYCPLEIFIIPKADLPRHELDSSYIASPFKISKAGCPFLNNYSALGIDANRLNSQIILPRPNELLPLTSKRIGLTSDMIPIFTPDFFNTVANECRAT